MSYSLLTSISDKADLLLVLLVLLVLLAAAAARLLLLLLLLRLLLRLAATTTTGVATSVAGVTASGLLGGGFTTVGTGMTGHIYTTTADYFFTQMGKRICPSRRDP